MFLYFFFKYIIENTGEKLSKMNYEIQLHNMFKIFHNKILEK